MRCLPVVGGRIRRRSPYQRQRWIGFPLGLSSREIARKFPSLHMLNGKAIPKMSFVLAPMVGPVLPQVQGNFFDLEETRLVALGFLEKCARARRVRARRQAGARRR